MFYCKCSQCPDCVISESVIFKDLLQEKREDVCSFLFLTRFNKKQIVALEGNPSQNIYVAKTGKFKSYKELDSGKQQIIRVYERGDILNLNSLCEPYYTESVEAITEAETCTINKVAFESFLERNPKISFELVKILTKELSIAHQTILELGQKDARSRLASYLISCIDVKEHESRSVTLPTALSRIEIANMIGVTQETLTRLLSKLKQDKIIDINEDHHIIIKNIPRLLKVAH